MFNYRINSGEEPSVFKWVEFFQFTDILRVLRCKQESLRTDRIYFIACPVRVSPELYHITVAETDIEQNPLEITCQSFDHFPDFIFLMVHRQRIAGDCDIVRQNIQFKLRIMSADIPDSPVTERRRSFICLNNIVVFGLKVARTIIVDEKTSVHNTGIAHPAVLDKLE